MQHHYIRQMGARLVYAIHISSCREPPSPLSHSHIIVHYYGRHPGIVAKVE